MTICFERLVHAGTVPASPQCSWQPCVYHAAALLPGDVEVGFVLQAFEDNGNLKCTINMHLLTSSQEIISTAVFITDISFHCQMNALRSLSHLFFQFSQGFCHHTQAIHDCLPWFPHTLPQNRNHCCRS